ncbi:MAG: thiamine pyrophosphate-binding protein [Dehalococcoidia bacterium]
MKVSDYVAAFLARQGVRHVFAVSGGASLHLIHSIAHTPGVDYVCPQHEQAGAMAADAYARATGGLGAAIATSGPGATNLITGVCGAYYDSVPVLYITGQVTTFRLKRDLGVRQLGFQETDVVDMFRPVTKYAAQVARAEDIRFHLEQAVHLATTGRPGPVLIDLPDDIQRAEVDEAALRGFTPEPVRVPAPSEGDIAAVLRAIEAAERPVLILGAGVRIAGATREAIEVAERFQLPILPTWGARDLLPAAHPLNVGAFGTHGTRHGNFAVQNADLVIAVGARLDTREAGSPLTTFARAARKVVVDIDPAEVGKFAVLEAPFDHAITADARAFLGALLGAASPAPDAARTAEWRRQIARWREAYPIGLSAPEPGGVDPYAFIGALSAALPEGAPVASDTGCALAWSMQRFEFKAGQRFYHAFNNTPMGYALPAAIGVAFATDRPVVCLAGDGSLQMSLQELSTVVRHRLPIKVFLVNNGGYAMIRQTQDQWFGGEYLASTVDGGLGLPDWQALSAAFGFATYRIDRTEDAAGVIARVLAEEGPAFCEVVVPPGCGVEPQVKFGRPLEDPEPLLPRAELAANMLIPLHPSSQVGMEVTP